MGKIIPIGLSLKYLNSILNIEDAISAYNKKALEFFGEYAYAG
jgi:hypothetical protein